MTDAVDDTLGMWRRGRFAWGDTDCMLSIGDYAAAQGAQDVTGLFRGRYADEPGADAMLTLYGGPSGIIDMAGLARVSEARRGDVVVIDTGTAHVGGLCTGAGVAIRLERGVLEINMRHARIVQAWAIDGKSR